jgi:hypothetical protein
MRKSCCASRLFELVGLPLPTGARIQLLEFKLPLLQSRWLSANLSRLRTPNDEFRSAFRALAAGCAAKTSALHSGHPLTLGCPGVSASSDWCSSSQHLRGLSVTPRRRLLPTWSRTIMGAPSGLGRTPRPQPCRYKVNDRVNGSQLVHISSGQSAPSSSSSQLVRTLSRPAA